MWPTGTSGYRVPDSLEGTQEEVGIRHVMATLGGFPPGGQRVKLPPRKFMMTITDPVSPRNVRITAGFWKAKQDLVHDRVIPYQWKALNDEIPGAEPSHSVENFRIAAGIKTGEFYGLVFQDSDIGKWIEAAAYSLMQRPDPSLEATIDGVVGVIAQAQEPDGYLQTYFSVKAPGRRWTDFAMGHEMYCGGHLIEGAVAYFQATGKSEFLEVMKRYADHLCLTFGPGPGQIVAYDGHPEIELALHKLSEVTGNEAYRDLARFFVNERGHHPGVLDPHKIVAWKPEINQWSGPDYYQDHLPVRDQTTAEGHAVRAMYLYTAMADQRRRDHDQTLTPALDALWKNVVHHRMYVTGGLGSHAWGERFSVDDDLPPDTAYSETCAAIGLALWAWRMTLSDPDGQYADVLERALYNGALAGISLDGTRYFYVNPLEVTPLVTRYRRDHDHVKSQRIEWFGCACCPPNIARTIASFGQYQYSVDDQGIWAHQFAAGRATLPFRGTDLVVDQTTDYPWDGTVTFTIRASSDEPWAFRVRLPAWCDRPGVSVNGQRLSDLPQDRGYGRIHRVWRVGDVVTLELPMDVRFVRTHPRVRETFGRVAVHRGPLVWCAEQVDNGSNLHLLTLTPPTAVAVEPSPELGAGALRLVLPGVRYDAPTSTGGLGTTVPEGRSVEVRLVPYHLWGNRGEGEMRVWLGIKE